MAPSSSELEADLVEQKRALRLETGRERAGLPERVRRACSQRACARLLALPELAQPDGRTVAGYVALAGKGELDPALALDALEARGARIAYPRVGAPDAPLTFHQAARGALVAGRFGLLEPPGDAPAIPPESLDLVVVPGVAFDADGGRLGFGGGFYDRTFGGGRGPALIGLCFDLQVVSRCPAGPEDVRVDAVVTESRVLRPGQREAGR
ncbi:MAG TPA: 5-formyltetrahydrofolate cyclo-ligase [Polyangia bacterium]|nr:5-formyltetrahydrofolate cyclo-ligase [Polyangia bacterium]